MKWMAAPRASKKVVAGYENYNTARTLGPLLALRRDRQVACGTKEALQKNLQL